MTDMPDREDIQVGLEVCCAVPQERLDSLVSIIQEMLNLLPLPGALFLKQVYVVSDDQYVSTVNAIIQANDPSSSLYVPGAYAASGAAIPLVGENGLSCFIVLTQSLVSKIKPDYWHPDAMSTVLEELLHVWVYGATWQRQGWLYPPKNPGDACKNGALSIVTRMHDEYIVNRTKATIFNTVPLHQPASGAARTTVSIKYGGQVATELDRGMEHLATIVVQAASGSLPVADAWEQVLNETYRGILEPLARSAAFDAISPEKNEREQDPLASRYYQSLISPYWNLIQQQLERSYSSDMRASQDALKEISATVTAFLTTVGVSCRSTSEGNCWVDFDTRFFGPDATV